MCAYCRCMAVCWGDNHVGEVGTEAVLRFFCRTSSRRPLVLSRSPRVQCTPAGSIEMESSSAGVATGSAVWEMERAPPRTREQSGEFRSRSTHRSDLHRLPPGAVTPARSLPMVVCGAGVIRRVARSATADALPSLSV
jgi:hypothetical protein